MMCAMYFFTDPFSLISLNKIHHLYFIFNIHLKGVLIRQKAKRSIVTLEEMQRSSAQVE